MAKKCVFRKCPKSQKAANHLRKIKSVIIRTLTYNLTNFIRDWEFIFHPFIVNDEYLLHSLWNIKASFISRSFVTYLRKKSN